MKPIINPWIVYLAEKCDVVMTVCLTIAVLCGALSLVWLMCYEAGDTEKVPRKWMVILAVLCFVIGILMPSKDTVYTMATLNYVTTDNIKAIGNTAGDVIDYVIDKIEEITDKD